MLLKWSIYNYTRYFSLTYCKIVTKIKPQIKMKLYVKFKAIYLSNNDAPINTPLADIIVI
jgi:hypothetical protein